MTITLRHTPQDTREKRLQKQCKKFLQPFLRFPQEFVMKMYVFRN